MNFFNIAIILVLSFFAVKGLLRGLVNEVASLAGLVLGGWVAYRYHPIVSLPLKNVLHIPGHITSFLAFMLLLMLAGVIAHVLGNILTAALRVVMLGGLNRLGGVLIGVAEGGLLLCMLFSIASADYMPLKVKQKIGASDSAALFARIGDRLLVTWRGPDKQP